LHHEAAASTPNPDRNSSPALLRSSSPKSKSVIAIAFASGC
jgi:hypothetical protein